MKNGVFTFLALTLLAVVSLATKAYSVETIMATFDGLQTVTTAPLFMPGHVVPTGDNMPDRPWMIHGPEDAFKIENSSTVPGVTLGSGNFLRVVDSHDYSAYGAYFDFYDRNYDDICVKVSWDVLFEDSDNYFFYFRNGRFDDPQHPAKSIIANIYTAGSNLYFQSKNGIVYRTTYQTRTPIHFDVYLDLANDKWAVVMNNEVLFDDAEIIDDPFGLFIPGYLNDRDLNGAMEVDNINMAPLEPCDWPNKAEDCSLKLPDPRLEFIGTETYTGSDGNQYIRYRLMVTNWTQYPIELFTPSPNLPPCGLNTSSSRTWVDIEDQNGRRLYGFCAFSKPEHLTRLWFGKRVNEAPPSSVRIIMRDRLCNREYVSNLATIDPNAVCRDLPVPQLQFIGAEAYSTASGNFTRYKLSVSNWNDFWPDLFIPSPNLPPCGLNNEASRSWVDIYDGEGNRIYGFCALSEPEDLTKLWFGISGGKVPERVKIVITDRLCDKSVESPLIRLPADQLASLKVTVEGSGRVISDTGISCTNNELASFKTCTFNVEVGQTVTLKAIPISGDEYTSSFVGWGGACSGSGNCTISAIAGESVVTAKFAAVGRPVQLVLPVPASANVFTYEPVAEPQFASIPAECKPFAAGNLSSGKIDLKVALPPFAGPVDVYLGIQATPISPFEIFLLVPAQPFGYNIVPYSTAGLIPWKQSLADAISQAFFGEIPIQGLPAGPYTLYTLVTPAGSFGNYYLWISTFTIP